LCISYPLGFRISVNEPFTVNAETRANRVVFRYLGGCRESTETWAKAFTQ
jgi:hypothetical protein